MNQETENYVKHEVKLRIHDYTFKVIEYKLNLMITIMVADLSVHILRALQVI